MFRSNRVYPHHIYWDKHLFLHVCHHTYTPYNFTHTGTYYAWHNHAYAFVIFHKFTKKTLKITVYINNIVHSPLSVRFFKNSWDINVSSFVYIFKEAWMPKMIMAHNKTHSVRNDWKNCKVKLLHKSPFCYKIIQVQLFTFFVSCSRWSSISYNDRSTMKNCRYF